MKCSRFDHRFERGLSEVTAEYTTQNNGMIKVLNSGFSAKLGKRRQAVGRAKLTNVPGVLRVSFFWIFYADYRVLALGDNYESGHSLAQDVPATIYGFFHERKSCQKRQWRPSFLKLNEGDTIPSSLFFSESEVATIFIERGATSIKI